MREYRVGSVGEIPERGKIVVACGEAEVGVFKLCGQIYAWHNRCAHRQGPVCQGRLFSRICEPVAADGTTRMLEHDEEELHIVCPWHGYEFNVVTGEHPGDPGIRLRKAAVRLDGEDVYVVV